MKTIIYIIALLVMLFGLTNNNISADPVNAFIESILPNQNAVSVINSADVIIIFTEQMDATTINNSSIKLFGMQTGMMSFTVNYNFVTKTATVNPDSNFKCGEKISVTLTGNIKTSTNTSIIPFNFTFTIRTEPGTAAFSEFYHNNLGYADITQINVGDLDKDNDLDLCVTTDDRIRLIKNNGIGIFDNTYWGFGDDNFYESVCLGDYDSDGDLDVAASTNIDLIIYKNNGLGIFLARTIFPGKGGKFLNQADFDCDGDIDLVSQNYYQNLLVMINVYSNDGNGNFDNLNSFSGSCGCPIYESYHYFTGMSVNDFDNDGDPDIVVNGGQDDNFIFNCHCTYFNVALNSGNGTFFSGSEIEFSTSYSNFISGDIDGNSYNDLICGPSSIFKNNNLNFSLMPYPGNSNLILANDFDGDGDLDIAERTASLNILKNNGTGVFELFSSLPAEFGSTGFASGDFDSDGVTDIVSAGEYVSELKVFMNINYSNNNFPVFLSPPSKECGSYFLKIHEGIPDTFNFTLYVKDLDPGDIITLESTALPVGATLSPPLPITGNPINANLTLITSFMGYVYFKATDMSGNETDCRFLADAPGPVELTAFNSFINGRDVILKWSTSVEENNYGFYIERMEVDNQVKYGWKEIGFVKGELTSNSLKEYLFEDKNLVTGKYEYRLKQTDINGNFRYYDLKEEIVIGVPDKYTLSQNYPNPFNPKTRINYGLPKDGIVKIRIFDITGREVSTLINEFKSAGYYTADFNSHNLSSGIYFYIMEARGFYETRKMMIIK